MKNRIGLIVADFQVLHRGHFNLINEMIMSCETGIIGLGSIKKRGIEGHPFDFEQRVEMIKIIFGENRFKFVGLDDIDAKSDIRDWYSYVKMKINKLGLPEPTDYFSGSRYDSKYYTHEFASLDDDNILQVTTKIYTNKMTEKRLHILDRELSNIPSGREIRLLIESRDNEWKKYVPERLHDFIEENYPPYLRLPILFNDIYNKYAGYGSDYEYFWNEFINERSSVGNYAVGTRIAKGKDVIYELKDDLKWRPLDDRDEKNEWSKKNKK